MFDFNEFKEYMVDLYEEDWMINFKTNPEKFKNKYFNKLDTDIEYDEYFESFNMDIIKHLGIKLDTVVNTPQIIWDGNTYKTDANIIKLSNKVSEKTGINMDDIRVILMGMINSKKQENKNPVFDQGFFIDAFNRIMDHEKYILDFELMEFKKVIGIDSNGRDIHTVITHDILNNTVTVNENARALNEETKSMSKEIMAYIEYAKNNIKTNALSKLVNDFIYDPQLEGFFEKFAKQVHSVYNCQEDLDVFTILLKQHYWQLKRRAMGKSVHNDIMLTFRGAQGIGKSYLMDALFGSVLGKFYNPSGKLSDICDERWTPALGNMLMVNIDETDSGAVGKLGGKGMASIKRVITNEIFTYRPMATNTTVEVRKKATFLSTSNFHIYEIMEDESGMRRFFEFNSKNEKQVRFDYDIVAKLKTVAMKAFKSVDETLEHGYWDINTETGKKITEIQSTYVNKSSLEDFIDTQLEYDQDMLFKDCMTHDHLYEEYKEYSKNEGVQINYIISKKNFRRKMEDTLYDCTRMQARVYKYKVRLKSGISNLPTTFGRV